MGQNGEQWRKRAAEVIPGGAHTYAKGDDQFPAGLAPVIDRGSGCRVWDADGNEYIEYGMGLRAVSLGHAYPSVVEAASREMRRGTNFVRPSRLEAEAAEDFLELVPRADMVKFAKNGSDATTAAVKLARAHTGREKVAVCGGFLSVDDWFIGTTTLDGGIPESVAELSLPFRYNDLQGLRDLFEAHPDQIACVVMEGEREETPEPGYLQGVQDVCRANGALFVLDEMVAGMRLAVAGVQQLHDLDPDLSTFGKALGNGFAVSALAGKRAVMSLGSLEARDQSRVFLLSTTHGAESHGLAAFREVARIYRQEGVIEKLYEKGHRLRTGLEQVVAGLGLQRHIEFKGRDSNLVYGTRGPEGRGSQAFRTLLLQETIRRGLLAPSLVVSYSHRDADIDETIERMSEALQVYARALDDGIEHYLEGRPVRPVFPG